MKTENRLKILHVLSQRPDSTGSGIYVQAMIREAAAGGYDNFLVAGLSSAECADTTCIEEDKSIFVNFNSDDVCYHIPGMSDVMPYESTRFCDLSDKDLGEYEKAFSTSLKSAVDRYKPDIIHSHHLWIVSSITRRLFPGIPMVTSCHGSDLRQFQNCSHLQEKVLAGCRNIDVVIALSRAQKKDIMRLYNLVNLPRLRHIDQPYEEDETIFENDLQKSMQLQMDAAHQGRRINMSLIQDKLNAYTWKGVFEKVRSAYHSCLP